MSSLSGFRAWSDRLLLAFAEADAESGGASVDLGVVASKRLPEFTPGWVSKAANVFQRRGWIELSPSISGNVDYGLHATLTGEGLEAAEALIASVASSVRVEDSIEVIDGGDYEITPAADRFVALDHNSPEYREGIAALSRLSESVRTTNSALFADESQRLAVVREIEGIKDLLGGTTVRLAAIAQHVRDGGVLPWIAVAAGAGVVGNYAHAAVEALRRLVGF